MLRTAEWYDFPVWGDRPSSARCAAKQHNNCSDTGNGVRTLYLTQKAWKRFKAAPYVLCVVGARPCRK